MKIIYFVTTNKSKYQDVKRWIEKFDPTIELKQADIDLCEPQSLDVREVALFKAKQAWNKLKKPLIVDDGGVYLNSMNKFPGTLSKYVFQGIGLKNFWKLAENDPSGYFLNLIVYIDGPDSYEFFQGVCQGSFIKPKDDAKNLNIPFAEIFIPEGYDKTISQMRGSEIESEYNHRYKAVKNFVGWLKNK